MEEILEELPQSETSEDYQPDDDEQNGEIEDDNDYYQNVTFSDNLEDEILELNELEDEENDYEEEGNIEVPEILETGETEMMNSLSSTESRKRKSKAESQTPKKKRKGAKIQSTIVGMRYWLNNTKFKTVLEKGKERAAQKNTVSEGNRLLATDDWNKRS